MEEGVTLTKHKEILTEVKLVETNEAFKFLQNCLNWIEAKQVKILNFDTKSIIFISVCWCYILTCYNNSILYTKFSSG